MTNLNPKIKNRTQLFFDTWQYCGLFYMPEVNAMRSFDHGDIDRLIEIRQRWNRRINYGGSWRGIYSTVEITADSVDNLHSMCEFFSGETTPKKLVFYTHNFYVYTNDINLISKINDTGLANLVNLTQAKVTGVAGTVMLKNSRYQYRTYFREVSLDGNALESVRSFLSNQEDIRLSPTLKWWIDQRYRRMLSYYFIDHNNINTLTMLSMIDPRLIRKTVPITAAK